MNRIAEKEITITQREFDILNLIVEGHNNRHIAKQLSISIHTVKAHLESIYKKFHVHNKLQAAICATCAGIIDLNRQTEDALCIKISIT